MPLASEGINRADSKASSNVPNGGRRRTPSQRARAWAGLGAITGVVASLAVHSPAAEQSPIRDAARDYIITALSQDVGATVLTLEPGLVGIQNLYHFTPRALQGHFCAAPNTCRPVDYLTLPGNNFNERGADKLLDTVKTLPADDGPAILMGYSQGAQVIYSALRRWQADPSTAPDPARISWVSIGNPDNPVGGVRNSFGNVQPRPAETPYAGTEVIRQYDGWADWPDNPGNLLAVFNAIVGMNTVHSNYFDVDINDPANVRYTPALADGRPGNVTYVWVPNPVLPLVAGFGPLAPRLDSMLRPIVEAGYNRPVPIPAPGAPASASVPRSASTTMTPEVSIPDALDAPSADTTAAPSRSGSDAARGSTRHRTIRGSLGSDRVEPSTRRAARTSARAGLKASPTE